MPPHAPSTTSSSPSKRPVVVRMATSSREGVIPSWSESTLHGRACVSLGVEPGDVRAVAGAQRELVAGNQLADLQRLVAVQSHAQNGGLGVAHGVNDVDDVQRRELDE